MNLACAEVTFISSLSFSTPALTSSQLFKHLVQSPMELRDSRCFLFFPMLFDVCAWNLLPVSVSDFWKNDAQMEIDLFEDLKQDAWTKTFQAWVSWVQLVNISGTSTFGGQQNTGGSCGQQRQWWDLVLGTMAPAGNECPICCFHWCNVPETAGGRRCLAIESMGMARMGYFHEENGDVVQIAWFVTKRKLIS